MVFFLRFSPRFLTSVFEDFLVSLQILGLSESRRQLASLDGNLPVRGCLLVVRRVHPGWKPFLLISGSTSTSQAHQELLGSAAQLGPPFFLDYAVHASCSSSPGALGQLPWSTQGFLLGCSEQGVLFPEGSQVIVKELLKACPS